MSYINFIITIIISTVGLSGIIIYIGKRGIDKALDIGVERFKSSLNKDLENHKTQLLKQTEELKANLQRLSLEHQIRYSNLHEQRALLIKRIYSLLIELQDSLNYVIRGYESEVNIDKEKNLNTADELETKLSLLFQKNGIYFSEAVANTIDEILKFSRGLIGMHLTGVAPTFLNKEGEIGGAKTHQEWVEMSIKVFTDIEDIKKKLQLDFRNILGVE